MDAVTLTDGERRKFAEWLRQDAASDRLLLGQMAQMALPESLVRGKRLEAGAKELVARLLESTETQTIGR